MMSLLFKDFDRVIGDVAYALAPLALAFIYFQIFMLKLPKRRVIKTAKGILMTCAGLALFLQGIHAGLMPAGEAIGMAIGSLEYNWILIPIGLILGFSAIMAEPSVMVLLDQVEKVSSGYINRKLMLFALSIGTALAVAIAMIRVLTGIPLWYFIVPGYIIAIILAKFASSKFVAIAFDAGAAATGPMTVTFILSMSVGVASQLEGRNPISDGLGMVSLVALAPILAILILGYLYRKKEEQINEGRL